MTHRDIVRAAKHLAADAALRHPTNRVDQAMYIVRPTDGDAFEKAIADHAFNLVFDAMTDAETQDWAIHCLYSGNRSAVLHSRQALERAA